MGIVLLVLSFLFLVIGALGTVLPVLPGLFMSYIGLLLLQFSGFGNFSTTFLIIMAIIVMVITLLDFFLAPIFAKKFGGSRPATIGSFLGSIIGTVFFAPLGIIFGSFIRSIYWRINT